MHEFSPVAWLSAEHLPAVFTSAALPGGLVYGARAAAQTLYFGACRNLPGPSCGAPVFVVVRVIAVQCKHSADA